MRLALVLAALFSISMLAGDVEGLRRGGQTSVDLLHAKSNGAPDELLDRVCAQKDCHTSRLFWYTDLERSAGRRARTRAADPLAVPARPPRRRAELREQPLLPRDALLRSGDRVDPARPLRAALAFRAPRAARDDRHGRRPQDPADDHRQQRALPARRKRRRARRAAGTAFAARVPRAARGVADARSHAARASITRRARKRPSTAAFRSASRRSRSACRGTRRRRRW